MASQGPSLPGTTATAGADTAWSSTDNAKLDDGSYTTCTLLANGTSQQLRLTNFGFTIPGGSVINGVEVKIERSGIGGGTISDVSIYLRKASGDTGTPKTGANWPGFDTIVTFGSSSDVWSASFSSSDVNDSGFGVDIQCNETGGSLSIAQIDYATISVYYSAGGAGVPSRSVLIIS